MRLGIEVQELQQP